jgi:preprotein translocase subunit YajC
MDEVTIHFICMACLIFSMAWHLQRKQRKQENENKKNN